jgi:dTDP-4-amino-4,6-dideoxygalactose transaminase
MKIPFVDLTAQYQSIKEEVLSTVQEVIESHKYIQGPYCQEFAENFCKVHGGERGVGCSNGTSAITVALRSLGVGPGDEVITVANTFFATLEAIAEVGANIVLVDIRPDTYGMDLEKLEEAISDKTKAIIPVHLYGNPVEMDRVLAMAKKYKLKILEDCAQAHLSQFKEQAVGTFGEFGTFSFYPGKNLGAYGDAGFILAGSEELLVKAKMQVDHGRTNKYEHDIMAGNFRMDGIQGAVLNIKTKYISEWTDQRISRAALYDKILKEKGFKVIEVQESAKCVYHLYIVEVSNRDEVQEHLKKSEIACGIHYPIPMHRQPAMAKSDYKLGDFPETERVSERILSLPIYPELTDEQVKYVCEKFLEVARP